MPKEIGSRLTPLQTGPARSSFGERRFPGVSGISIVDEAPR